MSRLATSTRYPIASVYAALQEFAYTAYTTPPCPRRALTGGNIPLSAYKIHQRLPGNEDDSHSWQRKKQWSTLRKILPTSLLTRTVHQCIDLANPSSIEDRPFDHLLSVSGQRSCGARSRI